MYHDEITRDQLDRILIDFLKTFDITKIEFWLNSLGIEVTGKPKSLGSIVWLRDDKKVNKKGVNNDRNE